MRSYHQVLLTAVPHFSSQWDAQGVANGAWACAVLSQAACLFPKECVTKAVLLVENFGGLALEFGFVGCISFFLCGCVFNLDLHCSCFTQLPIRGFRMGTSIKMVCRSVSGFGREALLRTFRPWRHGTEEPKSMSNRTSGGGGELQESSEDPRVESTLRW